MVNHIPPIAKARESPYNSPMNEMELTQYLESFLTDNRKERMDRVLSERTRQITVVLEDIYQPMNASAVLRHCDALGVQDVHIIENKNRWRTNKDVDLGTAQWLNIHRYNQEENNSRQALRELKQRGYTIVATTPHEESCTLEELNPMEEKLALVFGTEMTGISSIVEEEADRFMAIPMYGFVESFNISASCAMTLYTLIQKLRREGKDWKLSQEERDTIYLQWLRSTVKNAPLLEERFKESI